MIYSINYLDSLNRYSGIEIEAGDYVDLFNKLHDYSVKNKIGTSRVGRIKTVLEIIEVYN